MPATRKLGPRKRAKLSSEESEPESLHSDALDDTPLKKRARPTRSKPNLNSPSKPKPKRRKRETNEDEENEEDGSGVDLKDGQQVVGRVVQAPKTGWGNDVFLTYILDAHSNYLLQSVSWSDFTKHA